MRHGTLRGALLAGVVATLAVAAPVGAITNGQADGGEHPYVGELFNYKETLDTTYYGGYLVFGGEYSLFPALYGGWGLRSFIDLHAGIYGANADYNGHFVGRGIGGSGLRMMRSPSSAE